MADGRKPGRMPGYWVPAAALAWRIAAAGRLGKVTMPLHLTKFSLAYVATRLCLGFFMCEDSSARAAGGPLLPATGARFNNFLTME